MSQTIALPADPVTEPMLPRSFSVIGRHQETADTVTLDLQPDDGHGFDYEPGQFTMIYVYGIGEVPISIAGGGGGEPILVHTVRAVGAVTRALCALRAGDQVGIRGPYGVGWPLQAAEGKDVVIVGGGLGLAPLRAAVTHTLDHRERFAALSLLYGARTPNDLLYEGELRRWRSRFDVEVEVTVDRSDGSWRGDVGLVTNLMRRIEYDPARTVAMVCGPEIMMRVVSRELIDTGVDRAAVYVSLERNMQCGIGFCGHCQFGPDFVCRDGPVVPFSHVGPRLRVAEL